jgi:hypothetical protein
LKKPITKRAGEVAQGVDLEFKPEYHKKRKGRERGTEGRREGGKKD